MPIKIDFPHNEGYGLKISVIGIGENGSKVVSTYRHSMNSDNNKIIRSISYSYRYSFENCDETVIESIRDSEWLFVIADTDDKSDLESALHLVNIQKQNPNAPTFSVLIDVSHNHSYCNELSTSFNTIISVDDASKAMRPVEMLISNMYVGLCTCIDVGETRYLLNQAPYMKFQEFETDNLKTVQNFILQMKQELNKHTDSAAVLICILYRYNEFTNEINDDLYYVEVVNYLLDAIPEVDKMLQWNLFSDFGVTTFSFIYGDKVEKPLTQEEENHMYNLFGSEADLRKLKGE